MKRRQRRKIIALAVLLVLLLLTGLWFWNFQATKKLTIDVDLAGDIGQVAPPQYLYSFAGSGANRVLQPIGVLAHDGSVYVADGRNGRIFQFRENGTLIRVFGAGKLGTPLYLAVNPKDGLLYVSDRRKRAVFKFTTAGRFIGKFEPRLPKSELPKFKTDDEWVPVALAFAPDGRLYATEILNGHRVLMFDAKGAFVRAVGVMGVVAKATDSPRQFQFPNSVKVHKNEVWVVDSNNRRIQVFDLDLNFKRLVPVSGLPRGMTFLPPAANVATQGADPLVSVDTLSHDATIWTGKGEKLTNFGERGVLEGQFQFPGDTSASRGGVIFVTDTGNKRVQAWGWPRNLSPVAAAVPRQPAWCLGLLPLLLIPLLFRKRSFYATADFVEAMVDAGMVAQMQDRRRRWLVSQDDYDALRGVTADGISLADLLEATEYSETDARALEERLEIPHSQAAVLAAARRTKLFCTQDTELRRLARTLEIDVVNRDEFLAKYGAKGGAGTDV